MTNETTDKNNCVNNSVNNCVSDGFTIRPLTTTIDIKTLRQLLGSWLRNGVKYGEIPRILILYLGEPAWMNQSKEYPIVMFGEIARGLKFRSRQDFIETIIKCKGFSFIWKDEQHGHQPGNLFAFYTPIWHIGNEDGSEIQEEEAKMEEAKMEEDAVCNLPNCKRYINNYYINNNIKKNIKKKDIIYNTVCNLANCAEIEAAAQQLISYIATNPDAYANVVKPINELTLRLMPELSLDPSSSCPATDATTRFINEHLYPYILQHGENLMSIGTLLGQSCWLANLIRKDFMVQKIATAVNDTRRYLAQHPQERIRANRSDNGLEYIDPETGQRFYDTLLPDGSRKQHRIPSDAPTRPSDSAIWNKFAKKWNV